MPICPTTATVIPVHCKTQFTIGVLYEEREYRCHCPTTGSAGDIALNDRPCLLSPSGDAKRKTVFTVEAISLNKSEDPSKSWIGINQNVANRYVEHYLRKRQF